MYIMKPYDDALRNIYENGFDIEGDRTGVGTRCLFGISTEYDVSERVPLPVYREVKWKSFVKETLWYITGSHSISDLEKIGCKVWTPWKSKAFTDKHNLPEGSGGYIYGYNLRCFGGDINDETVPSFDQLEYVINTLRENPKSRQACFTFWRPDTNSQAVLPACHAFYSFIVSKDNEGNLNTLNLHIFQRSQDSAVGWPFNLWIGTLFLYMIAQQVDMRVGKLYHTGSHCHIYHNAFPQVEEYLSRVGTKEVHSPKLILNKKPSIYEYTVDDFQLIEYDAFPAIKMPIAV